MDIQWSIGSISDANKAIIRTLGLLIAYGLLVGKQNATRSIKVWMENAEVTPTGCTLVPQTKNAQRSAKETQVASFVAVAHSKRNLVITYIYTKLQSHNINHQFISPSLFSI